jgi:hypothetical protein
MKIDFTTNHEGHDHSHSVLYATAAAVVCFALVSCANITDTVRSH